MRGFSLIELMVGMLMTIALAAATLAVLQSTGRTALKQRKVLACERQLDLGWALLQHLLEGAEHNWWQTLPIRANFAEPADSQSGAVGYRRHCQSERNTPCLTIWDIAPRRLKMPIHQLVGGDLPHRLDTDLTSNQGPHADALAGVKPGDVVLVQGPETRFCGLIESVEGGLIFLAPERDQPWLIPHELPADEPLEALLLGPLTWTHVFLAGDSDGPERRRLFYRKASYSRYGWRDDRAKTACTQLVDLRFTFDPNHNLAQIHLYAQPQFAQSLPHALTIGPRQFHKETYHASYTF